MRKHIALAAGVMLSLVAPVAAAAPSLEQYYYNSTIDMQPKVEAAPAPDAAAALPAAEDYGGGHSQVVTSVKKCFEEIGPQAAARIRGQSLTPYADCQRYLREEARDAAAAAKEEPVAETPRNYRRVMDDAAPEAAEAAPAEKPAPSKKK